MITMFGLTRANISNRIIGVDGSAQRWQGSLLGEQNNTFTSHLPAILLKVWAKPWIYGMTTNFSFFPCFIGSFFALLSPNLYFCEQISGHRYQQLARESRDCEAFSLFMEARLKFLKTRLSQSMCIASPSNRPPNNFLSADCKPKVACRRVVCKSNINILDTYLTLNITIWYNQLQDNINLVVSDSYINVF